MTPFDEASSQPEAQKTARRRPRWPGLLAVLVFSVAIGFGFSYWTNTQRAKQDVQGRAPVHIPEINREMADRMGGLEEQLKFARESVTALTDRVEKLEQATENAPQETAKPAAKNASEDLERLKKDVKSFNESLASLQNQIKQASQAADESRQAALATMLTFVQLRAVARDGEGFAPELQLMRQAAGSDGVIMEALSKLDPIATAGAPTVAALREEFDDLISSAQSAERRAGAQKWWERIIAELQSLVTIRALHPKDGESSSYDAIDEALAQRQLDVALEKEKALPEAAQPVLKDWTAKAEARLAVDTALKTIGAHLLTRLQTPEPPASPGITVP